MRGMQSSDFANIRHDLGKTQAEMASLLGVSSKAVQSFEQGWRSVPGHVERQALFLLYLKACPQGYPQESAVPCWDALGCDPAVRATCPAWEIQAGHLCWFVNGTVCHGRVQESWDKKMELCRTCEVFRSVVPVAGLATDNKGRHPKGEHDGQE